MNDPWDVKSVRQSGQYISCMKLNGVPLLPPLLSKECRKEMQYYKLLAKEVEKRIDLLKPYVTESDTESTEDKTDAPDLPPDYDQIYQHPKHDVQDTFNVDRAIANENFLDSSTKSCTPESYDSVTSNYCKKLDASPNLSCHPQNFVIDLSVNINECGKGLLEKLKNPPLTDVPERDYNNTPKKKASSKIKRELLTDIDNAYRHTKSKDVTEDLLSFKFDIDTVVLKQTGPMADLPIEDGPSSLSAKSFTGSLNNIHREGVKEVPLIRQRSYTVLNPSPQLIAHLKVQSLSTGVDVTSISMSESLSNISATKKRRSWDLESAKVKWSSMALELKTKTVAGAKTIGNKNNLSKTPTRKTGPVQSRAKSVAADRSRRGSLPGKAQPRSEPLQRGNRTSPVRNIPSNKTIIKEPVSKPKNISPKPSPNQSPTKQISPIHKSPNLPTPIKQPAIPQTPNQVISNSEDPAARVRELYEKIQNQQLTQMNNLMEKQKREQILLQQVFEEQNSILYKQLKTICPKSPIEVKKAWDEKVQETPDRGPVSLSQLINHKPEKPAESPVTTLNDTQNNLNKCDTVLRRSRDITASMKRQPKSRPPAKPHSPKSPTDGSRTRTHSPTFRQTSASRRLNYETSPSPISDYGAMSASREFEPILTDRTNDTMAGLNVSFPTDSDDCPVTYNSVNSGLSQCGGKEITMIHCPQPVTVAPRSSTDSAIRVMEQTIHDSMNTMPGRNQSQFYNCPSPQQLQASTTIVAHAKGYLVRRLLRTERVQATVQTIKDALLCALQLHQDRAGIRGADVDLHRRLIQQITAACYSLHDTFITSTAAERCAQIATDRERRRQKSVARHYRHKSDLMSQSHSGVFPARAHRSSASLMTQSNYETFSGEKVPSRRYMPSPRRRPWR